MLTEDVAVIMLSIPYRILTRYVAVHVSDNEVIFQFPTGFSQ